MPRCLLPTLVLLAVLSGCDGSNNEAPSTFEATYSGAVSGTMAGSSSFTHQLRYYGLGSRDVFKIHLGEMPSGPSGQYVDSVTLLFEGIGEPAGTFVLHTGQRYTGATYTAGGLQYHARDGAIAVSRQGNRFSGTFKFAGSPILDLEADSVAIEGRFDVVRDD